MRHIYRILSGCAALIFMVFFQTAHANSPVGAPQWTSEVDSWFANKKSPWLMQGSRNSTFTLDGKQAVLSLTNGGLAIVDLRDQMVRTVIDFSLILGHDGAEPDSVAVSPLGLIAAAFPNRHEILLIDQKKMRVLERVKTSFVPMGLRFSSLGKYLFISNQRDKHAWASIYSIQKHEYLISRITPMVCDMSRDDRYLYLYDETKNSLRWVLTDTLQTVRVFNLSAIAPVGEPYTIKVLRDHRIALGFMGSLVISDRYLERAILTHIAPEEAGAVSFIEPSHDNRYLIFGRRGSLHILSLVNNLSEPLALPGGASSVSTYPNGNYILYTDQASRSTRIMRVTIPARFGDTVP